MAESNPKSASSFKRPISFSMLVMPILMVVMVSAVAISQQPIGTNAQPDGSRTFTGSPSPVPPNQIPSGVDIGAAGDMIGFTHSDGSGSQTITLVDTSKSWMAVYYIDRSGKIRLVSSRPIEADFSIQLNATEPLPDDIRRMGRR